MTDLLHKLVSAVLTGGLIALVGALSVAARRRRVAREEAAAHWRELTGARPGRFRAERRAALGRLGALLAATGQEQQAAQVRQEATRLA
ncbi:MULTISPECIES: hypothetical protein [Streptomyces]|uniref:Sensor histidine kinase n=1 Tax=Streptomyces siderophoricus TaxID=2802281 RepID=A0ABS1MLK5_9ACTN|nr:hypothetical protein [Streptomyces sp. 9-7]MBL1088140.1 hypothetical protein [Streptomyces sp. 9-7]